MGRLISEGELQGPDWGLESVSAALDDTGANTLNSQSWLRTACALSPFFAPSLQIANSCDPHFQDLSPISRILAELILSLLHWCCPYYCSGASAVKMTISGSVLLTSVMLVVAKVLHNCHRGHFYRAVHPACSSLHLLMTRLKPETRLSFTMWSETRHSSVKLGLILLSTPSQYSWFSGICKLRDLLLTIFIRELEFSHFCPTIPHTLGSDYYASHCTHI